jgi:hypothetical protein
MDGFRSWKVDLCRQRPKFERRSKQAMKIQIRSGFGSSTLAGSIESGRGARSEHWRHFSSEDLTMTIPPDPTRSFSLLTMAIMAVKFLAAHDWNVNLLLEGSLLNIYFLSSFLVGILVWKASGGIRHLSVKEQYIAEWYWWNAVWFHAVLDGLTGSLWLIPVTLQQYRVYDRRFVTGHVVPYVVGLIELFVMCPLSFAIFWVIVKKHPLRYPMELILSSIQWMGMVIFIAAELYEEQVNIPALDPVGKTGDAWNNIKFDVYHLTYYWFGFWFCNLVWCFVPLYRIYRALKECHKALRWSTSDKKAKRRQHSAVDKLSLLPKASTLLYSCRAVAILIVVVSSLYP